MTQVMNELINDKDVCRTATDTMSLLKTSLIACLAF